MLEEDRYLEFNHVQKPFAEMSAELQDIASVKLVPSEITCLVLLKVPRIKVTDWCL